MAPSFSSLSPAALAYVPKRGAPCIPPPPPPAPGLVTYICKPQLPPEFLPCPPPEFLQCSPPQFMTCPPLAPPPPPPCWSVPQVPFIPAMHGAAAFQHAAMPMVMTSSGPGPAPDAWPPRRHLVAPRMQRAAGPATTVLLDLKAAMNAKEAATNQPSPRSVLTVAVPSPPISPTTSLPTSSPYQLMRVAPTPATAGLASAAAPSPAEGTVAVRPPRRPRRQLRGVPRRVRRPSTVLVRHTVKPRRLFDPSSERTSLMIRNIPNEFTRTRLMNIVDQHCFIENEKVAPGGVRSEYDFLYLPVDFRSFANKGFAFVNMTSPEAARRLWEDLNGNRWAFKKTSKTCAVDYAELQGHDELVKHFSVSCFDCKTEEYLPVRFEPPRDGTRPAWGAMHVVGRLGCPGARDGK